MRQGRDLWKGYLLAAAFLLQPGPGTAAEDPSVTRHGGFNSSVKPRACSSPFDVTYFANVNWADGPPPDQGGIAFTYDGVLSRAGGPFAGFSGVETSVPASLSQAFQEAGYATASRFLLETGCAPRYERALMNWTITLAEGQIPANAHTVSCTAFVGRDFSSRDTNDLRVEAACVGIPGKVASGFKNPNPSGSALPPSAPPYSASLKPSGGEPLEGTGEPVPFKEKHFCLGWQPFSCLRIHSL